MPGYRYIIEAVIASFGVEHNRDLVIGVERRDGALY